MKVFFSFAVSFAVSLSAFLAHPTSALADVVGPPATGCLEGTEGATCHGGPFCRPLDCKTDADCGNGLVCKDKPQCIGSIICAGLLPPDANPNDYAQPSSDGACPNGDECVAPAACETRKVCVSDVAPPPPSTNTEAGCSCRFGSLSGQTPVALGLVVGASAIALSRLRQRKPSRQRRS